MPYRVGHGNAGLTGGEVKLITKANPAAGADATIAIPAGKIWRPMALSFRLTTSAAAGNRHAEVRLVDGSGIDVLRRYSRYEQPASLTTPYYAAPNTAGVWGTDGAFHAIIPFPTNTLVPSSLSFAIVVAGFHDAGDQLHEIRLLVEEWEGV